MGAACSRIRAALDEGLAQAPGVPLLTVSARTGKGLDRTLELSNWRVFFFFFFFLSSTGSVVLFS